MTMFNAEPDQRARLRGGRQFRRLPPADARRVRRSRPAPQHAADVGQLDQHRPAAAADGLLLPRDGAARASRRLEPAGRSCLDAERQLRQPDGRPDGEARRAADRAFRRRHQRQRRRARLPRDRPVRAAAVEHDARPTRWTSATRATSSACCGCTAATSTRCAPTSSAAGFTRRRGEGDDPAGLRDARVPARPAQRDCATWG